jgi:hypothetical protein
VEAPEDKTLITELESFDPATAGHVRSLMTSASIRKATLLKSYDSSDWGQPLEPLSLRGADDLATSIASLRAKAIELELLDVSKELATRRKEVQELKARDFALEDA